MGLCVRLSFFQPVFCFPRQSNKQPYRRHYHHHDPWIHRAKHSWCCQRRTTRTRSERHRCNSVEAIPVANRNKNNPLQAATTLVLRHSRPTILQHRNNKHNPHHHRSSSSNNKRETLLRSDKATTQERRPLLHRRNPSSNRLVLLHRRNPWLLLLLHLLLLPLLLLPRAHRPLLEGTPPTHLLISSGFNRRDGSRHWQCRCMADIRRRSSQ